jgi:hypothetical protein
MHARDPSRSRRCRGPQAAPKQPAFGFKSQDFGHGRTTALAQRKAVLFKPRKSEETARARVNNSKFAPAPPPRPSRRTAIQLRRTAIQLRRTAIQSRRTAIQSRRTAIQSRRTAIQLRRTAIQSRRTAIQLRRTAIQSRRTAIQSRRTAIGAPDISPFRLNLFISCIAVHIRHAHFRPNH